MSAYILTNAKSAGLPARDPMKPAAKEQSNLAPKLGSLLLFLALASANKLLYIPNRVVV